MTLPRFCSLCAGVVNALPLVLEQEQEHYGRYADVEKAAKRGCYVCTRIQKYIFKNAKDGLLNVGSIHSTYKIRRMHPMITDNDDYIISFEVRSPQPVLGRMLREFDFIFFKSDAYVRKQLDVAIGPSFRDPLGIRKARDWINRCHKDHDCQRGMVGGVGEGLEGGRDRGRCECEPGLELCLSWC